ncbi:MAG: hypothetical protein HOC71_17520, partial [Candidatus Latescibacteria bacterium]|nr:hypothetical protein [Candidatus Latescibacterota bacterium]
EMSVAAGQTAPAEETPAANENDEPRIRENEAQKEQVQQQAIRNTAQNVPGRNRFDVVA